MTQSAYIISAIRTPIGKAGGVFKQTRPDDLLAFLLKQSLALHPSIDPNFIDDVIIGCAMPEAQQGLNVARIALLLAGYPQSVSGLTVNRFCASGLQSIAQAADRIRLNEVDVILAGGVESMSLIPMSGNTPKINPVLFKNEHQNIAYGMGITAEQVAQKYNVSREQQDVFALQSHTRAIKAVAAKYFDDEIIPFTTTTRYYNQHTNSAETTANTITRDEGIRTDTSLEKLARLKPVFDKNGTVTAGNSSQMSDAAGVVVLCSEAFLKRFKLTPLAKFLGFAVSGVAPEVMGIAPVLAIPKVLKQCGLKQNDMAHIELNEAFAAQSLAVIKTLNLNPDIVNPLGGAIALGHPLGATGTLRTATLLHHLKRSHNRYGMVTMCIGTGMGAAAIFESM